MNILIEQPRDGEEDQVVIRCRNMTGDILRAIELLRQPETVFGYQKNQIFRLVPADIYYIESVDNNVFIYDAERVFDGKSKLYEYEQQLGDSGFLRVSKSTVLNAQKIESLSPALSGRFEALLDNGERIIISRQYVPLLKQRFGI